MTPEAASASATADRRSRAPSVGGGIAVALLGLAGLGQVAVAVVLLLGGEGLLLVAGLALPPPVCFLALVRPLRRRRWPLTVRQARRTGLLWLVVGLPGPLWLFAGQLQLGLASVAAVPLLVGAALGWARDG